MVIGNRLEVAIQPSLREALDGGTRTRASQANPLTFPRSERFEIRSFKGMPCRTRSLVSLVMGSVRRAIHHVAAMGIPAQVLQAIVRWVAIVMAGFHAFGSGAEMRFQNQPVDESGDASEVPVQHHMQVPIRSNGWTQYLPLPAPAQVVLPRDAADSASIRDLVRPFVADHRQPLLIHGEESTRMRLKKVI